MKKTILFRETTKPNKGILSLFIGPYLFLIYGAIRQVAYGFPLGTKPISDLHLILFVICSGIFIFLFCKLRTELIVTSEGFYLNTTPLTSGDLHKWNRIKEIRIENYHPIKEHLGIGFRGINNQMAYLAGGKPGIKLHFHNDDKILLAARDQKKLIRILSDMSIIKTDANEWSNEKSLK